MRSGDKGCFQCGVLMIAGLPDARVFVPLGLKGPVEKMNKILWASWLLITPDVTLYFGGDTGYFKGFEEIGRRFPDIDYAFMATTAYHPRWFMAYNHMNIPEAIQGFEELGARYFIPTQWGTFHLGDEPAGYPGLDLARYIEDNQVDASRFKIMDIGQILAMDSEATRKKTFE